MRKLALTLLVILYILAAAPQTAAQSGPTIIENEVEVDFPRSAAFTMQTDSTVPLAEASLNFDVARAGCLESGTIVPAEIEGSGASWTWVMNRSGNPPPGTEISWQWQATDEAGNEFSSQPETIVLSDQRFQWQILEAERVRIHWYDDQQVAEALMQSAIEGLARLEAEMGIQLQDGADFYVYENSPDMLEAVIYRQDWAGALAYYNYNTILIGVNNFNLDDWGLRTVAHELAHLVIGQFAKSCAGGSRPTWLDEGLATFAEGEPDERVLADIALGIDENRFLPLRSLNGSFPADPAEASIAYSQSYSVAAYLFESQGADNMKAYLLALADGLTYDQALEQVYGFNTDGLEAAWRDAIEAPARQILPTPTPLVAAQIPTVIPLSLSQARPTPPPGSEIPANDSDDTGGATCLPGLIPVLLLAGAGLSAGRRRE
jgi:hypothetical protein